MNEKKKREIKRRYKELYKKVEQLREELQEEYKKNILVVDYESYIANEESIENRHYIEYLLSDQYNKIEELKEGW